MTDTAWTPPTDEPQFTTGPDWGEFGEPVEFMQPVGTESPFMNLGDDDPNLLEDSYDEPSAGILKAKARPRGAVGYEAKVNNILMTGVAFTAGNPATVTDAAALLIHGKKMSYAYGDLAATDTRVAGVVDFLNGGTMSPLGAAIAATLPLVLQLVRNHEPELSTVSRISLPFTRGRIGFKLPSRIKFKLGNKTKNMFTNDSYDLYHQAFLSDAAVNQDVIGKLGKKGISVARYVPRHATE